MDRLDPAASMTSNARPWVFAGESDELDPYVQAISALPDCLVVRFDGKDMQTLDDLFEVYGRAFGFPAYFGKNWPAFDECMSDLNDTPSPVYLVVVEEAERLLDDDSDELSTFLKVCSAIGRYWSSRIGLGSLWGGGEVAFNTLILFSRPSGPVLDTIRSDHEILTLRDG